MQGDAFAPHLVALCSIKQWGKPHKEKRRCLLRFTLRRESCWIPEICLTDLDFAMTLFCLTRLGKPGSFCATVEIDGGKVELSLNAKKTKAKYFSLEKEEMKTVKGTKIKQVVVEEAGEQDFKYLGSWVCSKERDINVANHWPSNHWTKWRTSGRVTSDLDMFFVRRALQRNSSVITWVPPGGRGLVERMSFNYIMILTNYWGILVWRLLEILKVVWKIKPYGVSFLPVVI